MTRKTYDKNDRLRLWGLFQVAGVDTDPTTITLKIKTPAAVTTTYTYALGEITKSATGRYYRDVTLDQVGVWYYRFEGAGAVISAGEENFTVRATQF